MLDIRGTQVYLSGASLVTSFYAESFLCCTAKSSTWRFVAFITFVITSRPPSELNTFVFSLCFSCGTSSRVFDCPSTVFLCISPPEIDNPALTEFSTWLSADSTTSVRPMLQPSPTFLPLLNCFLPHARPLPSFAVMFRKLIVSATHCASASSVGKSKLFVVMIDRFVGILRLLCMRWRVSMESDILHFSMEIFVRYLSQGPLYY